MSELKEKLYSASLVDIVTGDVRDDEAEECAKIAEAVRRKYGGDWSAIVATEQIISDIRARITARAKG